MPEQSWTIFESMSREELLRVLEMFAKNWLAHDGSCFLAVEERFGMQMAIELDARSWERFAATEARRIMATFRRRVTCIGEGLASAPLRRYQPAAC